MFHSGRPYQRKYESLYKIAPQHPRPSPGELSSVFNKTTKYEKIIHPYQRIFIPHLQMRKHNG